MGVGGRGGACGSDLPSTLPVEAAPSRAHKEAILSSGRGTNLAFVPVCVNGSGGSSPREGNRRAARLLSQHHPRRSAIHPILADTRWLMMSRRRADLTSLSVPCVLRDSTLTMKHAGEQASLEIIHTGPFLCFYFTCVFVFSSDSRPVIVFTKTPQVL